ncbi:MAG: hypothetical protein IRZ04_18060 [Rhodospirillales bacterium]|jgi:hypothetical protein|nr:hypothetical protein [Rhodospirillales bacterium]
MSAQEQKQSQPVGGVVVNWLLAAPARTFTSKTTGEPKTVIELRDPSRLSNSLVVFLDGSAGTLGAVQPRTPIALRLDEVRAGRGRGELIGVVAREAVEAAFARAGGAS